MEFVLNDLPCSYVIGCNSQQAFKFMKKSKKIKISCLEHIFPMGDLLSEKPSFYDIQSFLRKQGQFNHLLCAAEGWDSALIMPHTGKFWSQLFTSVESKASTRKRSLFKAVCKHMSMLITSLSLPWKDTKRCSIVSTTVGVVLNINALKPVD